jgi:hypothetical protein
MTITRTALASAASGGSPATTLVTGSFTPTASSKVVIFAFAEEASGGSGGTMNPSIATTITGWTTSPTRTDFKNDLVIGFRPGVMVFEGEMGASPSSGTMTITWNPSSYGAMQVFDLTGSVAMPTRKQTSALTLEDDGDGNSETHTTASLGVAATTGNTCIVAFGANADNGAAAATPSGWSTLGTPQSAAVTTVGIFARTDFTGTTETCSDLGQTVLCSGAILLEFEETGGAVPVGDQWSVPVFGPGSQGPEAWQWQQLIGLDEPVVSDQIVAVDPAILVLLGTDLIAGGTDTATSSVDVATLALTGVTPTAAGSGSADPLAVDVALLTLLGIDPAATATGSASLGVDVATLTLTGQDLSAAATGSATIAVDVAALVLSGQTPGASGTGDSSPVAVDPAALVLTGVTPGASGSGTVSTAVDVALLVLTGIDPTPAGTGTATVALDPASLALIGVTPGAAGTGTATFTLDPAVLVLTGIDISADAGGLFFAVDPAILTLAGIDVTAAGTGTASVAIDPALLALLGIDPAASVVLVVGPDRALFGNPYLFKLRTEHLLRQMR